MSTLPRATVLVAALVLAAALLLGAASAQLSLTVDGRTVGVVRTDVVSGTSYTPADALAAGLGASLASPLGSGTLAFTLGGHVVEVDVVDTAADAFREAAVRADGRAAGDLAAVRGDDALWVPVGAVARAFGGHVTFLPGSDAVVVVGSRPTLTASSFEGGADGETLRLRLDAPTSWSRFENPALGLTELHLRRARLERARTEEGRLFRRVDLIPEGDGVRVRVDAGGASLEVVAVADGIGTELRVRARPSTGESGSEDDDREALVMLDVGSGPGDDGDAPQRALAREVASRLEREGVRVRLTRGVGAEGELAARADLFVALEVVDLPAGEVRLWVMGDAPDDDAMQAAVRRNAATALAAGVEDEMRRRILLGLVPDLEVGRRYGQAIATALFGVGGYRAGSVEEAPLAILEGAGGRGVLIELSSRDLGDPRLAEALAAGIRGALAGAR